jgi:hypothetical protein
MPVVREFLSRVLGEVPKRTEIHPGDEMYAYNLKSLRGSPECAAMLYYSKGRQIARTARDLLEWRCGDPARVGSFLDFASGYGRSTRFLDGVVPADRLWVSDVHAEAVEFQERVWGVHGIVSPPVARDFPAGRKHDVILASSFFSHMPARSFADWLAVLCGALAEDGVLAFSALPRELLGGTHDWSQGIVFLPESESSDLPGSEYGTAYVSDEFVRTTAAAVTGGAGRLRRFARGLAGHQDLYVLSRGREPTEPFAPTLFPSGELTGFER